jgi:hypothetical protein
MITIEVKKHRKVTGKEAVLLYLSDKVASITLRSKKRLVRFEK